MKTQPVEFRIDLEFKQLCIDVDRMSLNLRKGH